MADGNTATRDAARRNGGAPDAESDGGVSGAAVDAGAAVRALGELLGRTAAAVAEQAQARVPTADLDARDPDYIRETLPGLWMLVSLYFRAEVRGLHHIPEEGGVLLVGNHSGGNMTPDSMAFSLAFNTYFGVERGFYQLAHNLVVSMPHLSWMRYHGTVAATPENASQALETGNALLVYPGGDYEVHRPSWESAKVDFNGRKGFIRTALEHNVPLVPVVSIGGQETALFLSRGERLAKLFGLDRMFRLKVLPISLAPPWGLNVGDMLGHLPLPAKLTIQVLPAVDVRKEYGRNPDLDEAYDDVVKRMQGTLSGLQAERRLPLLG
jgi:1-acyl-sn-glycerol-3-phosphate acyltransferase